MAPPSPSAASILYTKGLPLLTAPTHLNPHAPLGKWLLATSSLVFTMVHIGGITRLTKSGLSMTDWKPLGSRPPITAEEWEAEFERYKTFPEWQQRQSMSLEEFQYIYYWEWGHRMLGRVVGMAFVLPWAYFSWFHRPALTAANATVFNSPSSTSLSLLPRTPILSAIPPNYQPRLALLFALGGTQGLVGWWMVRSGLGEDRRGDKKEIRVSPYRLAAHLGMAVGTYSLLVWTGLGALSYPVDWYVASFPASGAASAAATGSGAGVATTAATNATTSQIAEKSSLSLLQHYARNLTPASLRHAQNLRMGTLGTLTLTGLTILSGAFVAGNDAGNAYNTYPFMNDRWIPWEDMIDPELEPKYRNLFETTATVQWNHRALGTMTALSAVGLAGYGLLHPSGRRTSAAASSTASVASGAWKALPGTTPQVRRGLLALGTAATAQMSLGIATLLNYVPLPLAASHQLGSLVVLTCGIYTAHSLRYAGRSVLSKVSGSHGIVGGRSAWGGGGNGSTVGGKAVVAVSKMHPLRT